MQNTKTASNPVSMAPEICELDGKKIKIRPISRDDIPLEADFIQHLSPEAKHYRFFCALNTVSESMLESLCNVDGENAMAFIATEEVNGKEVEIGVSRYAIGDEQDVHEIAVTIADSWQHKGLGKLLMSHLIDYAKTHEVKTLFSVELADNSTMRSLAKELGMTIKADPQDVHQVLYTLSL
ncbi:MAG: GNAT superfamily N-acetyltransferase [Paraglaciecola sp.]|jgi:GNAT superfamily N-acetyltransferase